MVLCADPAFDKALLCTFQFEKPQQLKVAVFSRNKLGTGDAAKDSMLGASELLQCENATCECCMRASTHQEQAVCLWSTHIRSLQPHCHSAADSWPHNAAVRGPCLQPPVTIPYRTHLMGCSWKLP